MALLERVASLLNVDLSQAPAEARKSLILDIENQMMQVKTQAASEIAVLRRMEAERAETGVVASQKRKVEMLTGALGRLEAKRREAKARVRQPGEAVKTAPAKNIALEKMLKTLKTERRTN